MGPTRMTQNNLPISGASAETHPQSPFCHVRSHVLGFQGRGRGSLWGPPFCPPQPVRRGPWVCSDRARPEQSGSWGGEPAGAPSPPPCVTRSKPAPSSHRHFSLRRCPAPLPVTSSQPCETFIASHFPSAASFLIREVGLGNSFRSRTGMTLTSSHRGRRVAGCRRKSALILGPFWVLGPIPDDLHILTILPPQTTHRGGRGAIFLISEAPKDGITCPRSASKGCKQAPNWGQRKRPQAGVSGSQCLCSKPAFCVGDSDSTLPSLWF